MDSDTEKMIFAVLQMARELVINEHTDRRAQLHNQWLYEYQLLWRTRKMHLKYPDIPPYPTEQDVIERAQVLLKFLVLGKSNDSVIEEPKSSITEDTQLIKIEPPPAVEITPTAEVEVPIIPIIETTTTVEIEIPTVEVQSSSTVEITPLSSVVYFTTPVVEKITTDEIEVQPAPTAETPPTAEAEVEVQPAPTTIPTLSAKEEDKNSSTSLGKILPNVFNKIKNKF